MARLAFRWWHAVIIFVVANVASALPAGYYGDELFYNSFELPKVAPPDWLFAPMWLFLNVTSLVALYIVANAPERTGPPAGVPDPRSGRVGAVRHIHHGTP